MEIFSSVNNEIQEIYLYFIGKNRKNHRNEYERYTPLGASGSAAISGE